MLIPNDDIHFSRFRFFCPKFFGKGRAPVYLPPMSGFGV